MQTPTTHTHTNVRMLLPAPTVYSALLTASRAGDKLVICHFTYARLAHTHMTQLCSAVACAKYVKSMAVNTSRSTYKERKRAGENKFSSSCCRWQRQVSSAEKTQEQRELLSDSHTLPLSLLLCMCAFDFDWYLWQFKYIENTKIANCYWTTYDATYVNRRRRGRRRRQMPLTGRWKGGRGERRKKGIGYTACRIIKTTWREQEKTLWKRCILIERGAT